METIKRQFRLRTEDINYVTTTVASYDGMAVVRTVDRHEARIEIGIAPGCENVLDGLLESLVKEEGIVLEEVDHV